MIIDTDFPDHWKTRMLVDLLDGDEAAPVYLLRLWAHCQNRKKSEFENFPCAALKAVCRFPGHANKFESSLAASGFVRREDNVLIVSGWMEYNAGLIANWENGKKGGRPPKNKPTENPRETHGKPMANPSITDKSRVDKSRVDKEEKDIAPGISEDGKPGAKQVLEFSCQKKGETWWLTADKCEQLAEAFPYVDILAEAKSARQWIIDNPAKRKTSKGYANFLSGWIRRNNDRGNATLLKPGQAQKWDGASTPQKPKAPKPPHNWKPALLEYFKREGMVIAIKRMGAGLDFKSWEDVPVEDRIKVREIAHEIEKKAGL